MRIMVNDEQHDVAESTLAGILTELGYGAARVATAINGTFVPASRRSLTAVAEGARLEILAPMQGG